MKHTRALVLLLLLLALPALACGGEAEPTETPTPAATATPAPTPTPSADDHVEQGIAYAEEGELDKAVAEFEAALELEPDNADAHANLGLVYLDQEQYEEASAEFDAALAVAPDNVAANGGLCVAYAFTRPEAGETQCQTALELDPENADLHNSLGVAYVQLDRLDEAIAAFEEAIRLEPEHNWAHNNLGRAYFNQGRYEEAIVELNEAIRITPDNTTAYYNLGAAYARNGNFEDSLAAYEQAVEIDPQYAAAYYDLGLLYRELGEAEDSILAFQAYLELRPDDPDREKINAMILEMRAPLILGRDELPDGNTLILNDALTPGEEDRFQFLGVPGGEVTVIVEPKAGQDVVVGIQHLQSQEVLAAVDDSTGREELTFTIPLNASPDFYRIVVLGKDGAGGDYNALFVGSAQIAFNLEADPVAIGNMPPDTSLAYIYAGSAGETLRLVASPIPGNAIDLVVRISLLESLESDTMLLEVDDAGVGEDERMTFTLPQDGVYGITIKDAAGEAGRYLMATAVE